MNEYLELIEIKKNFNKKLSNAISDYDIKKSNERDRVVDENYSLKNKIDGLRFINQGQILAKIRLEHALELSELELSKLKYNNWFSKLFKKILK